MAKSIKNHKSHLKLNEVETMFNDLFDNAGEGIVILDVCTLSFIRCNANAEKFLQLSKQEILETGPVGISPEFQLDGKKSDKKAEEMIIKALNGEKPIFEWVIKNKKKEMILLEAQIVAMSFSQTPQVFCSFIDITKRKAVEDKLLLQNQHLREIAVLQAHQVRQPIANILGLINLFNYSNYDDPINIEILNKVKIATQQFDDIIHQIVSATNNIYSFPADSKTNRPSL